MQKKIYTISGMDCASCATLLEMDLEDAGIKAVCSYYKSELEIEGQHDKNKVIEVITKSGYSISDS
jgi:hypothetical protein